MNWFRSFISNHVLANLFFVIVLILGAIAFSLMPRERDPEINFNWVSVVTVLPGASAEDIEKRITNPLEEALERSVNDLDFVQSASSEGVSTLTLRFNEIDERTFDKRMADVRREVQNTSLPTEAEDPTVIEFTTSSGLPTASVIVAGLGEDANLRRQARAIRKDIELINGVRKVDVVGLPEPELHISYLPEKLEGLGITPSDLSNTVRGYFQDISAGDLQTDSGRWVIRIVGAEAKLDEIADYPILTAQGVVPLGSVAQISRETKELDNIVRYNGKPGVILFIIKQASENEIELIGRVNNYIRVRNETGGGTGVKVELVDDQTIPTREAINTMSSNALIGLFFVVLVTLAFLGFKVAILTSIGVPFTLAGTFLVLYATGTTLNNSVLLGVVIALGMLVDDAVVVVEAIYQQLRKGLDATSACVEALKEVFAPVTTSVLTTMAVFLPLILLPGILGEFMRIIPTVVILGLAVSLIEAYWLLPSHIVAAKIVLDKDSTWQRRRTLATHWIRLRYTKILIKSLRKPWLVAVGAALAVVMAFSAINFNWVRVNFFAADSMGLFYVTIEMPAGTTLEETSIKTIELEKSVRALIPAEKLRATVAYSGFGVSDIAYLSGDAIGQVMVSLNEGGFSSDKIVASIEEKLEFTGVKQLFVFHIKAGPPVTKAVSIRLLGDDIDQLREASEEFKKIVEQIPHIYNTSTDYRSGNPQMQLRWNGEAIKRAGLDPSVLNRSVQTMVDGEVVASFQDSGQEVDVRVLAQHGQLSDVDQLLRISVATASGSMPLGELVDVEYSTGQQEINHYNFRQAIQIEADIEVDKIDTVEANRLVAEEWDKFKIKYPTLNADYSGVLDDITEALDAIKLLFLLGVGLIYIILGAQFKSYWQPLLVLCVVPLAFTGVVMGLLITGNPLSLYSMYGAVALAGISVNAAIVLVSAANDRINAGMSVLHATIYASRRRVLPILITSLTTIAGLAGLALGLGGHSLVWGPVATAIVSGLVFSTSLALIVIPILFRFFMKRSKRIAEGARLH